MSGKIKVIFKKSLKIEEVKFGYAVNYLFPQGLAVLATDKAIDRLKKEAKKKVVIIKATQEEIEKIIKELRLAKIKIKAKVKEKKKLFGSVTKSQIKKELEKIIKKDETVKPPKIEVELKSPIKQLGRHEVSLKIGKSRAKVKVSVVKE